MRLPIHLQREIARLHFYDTSQSNRAIGRAVGVSANTVRAMRGILENHREAEAAPHHSVTFGIRLPTSHTAGGKPLRVTFSRG